MLKSLWLSPNDLTTEAEQTLFLQRIQQGKIDLLVMNLGRATSANTLSNIIEPSVFEQFKTLVQAVNPNMKFFGAFAEGDIISNYPNLSTIELRNALITEVIAFMNRFGFEAVIDDIERWTTYPDMTVRKLFWNECAARCAAETSKLYYPWIDFSQVATVNSDKCSVGLYDSSAYLEAKWKYGLDKVQVDSAAKSGYNIFIISGQTAPSPTVAQQLTFLDQQIALHSLAWYSRLEAFGIWWYHSMTAEDWNAWISWVNATLPTLPFNDSFANLDEWTKINGTWSAP